MAVSWSQVNVTPCLDSMYILLSVTMSGQYHCIPCLGSMYILSNVKMSILSHPLSWEYVHCAQCQVNIISCLVAGVCTFCPVSQCQVNIISYLVLGVCTFCQMSWCQVNITSNHIISCSYTHPESEDSTCEVYYCTSRIRLLRHMLCCKAIWHPAPTVFVVSTVTLSTMLQ